MHALSHCPPTVRSLRKSRSELTQPSRFKSAEAWELGRASGPHVRGALSMLGHPCRGTGVPTAPSLPSPAVGTSPGRLDWHPEQAGAVPCFLAPFLQKLPGLLWWEALVPSQFLLNLHWTTLSWGPSQVGRHDRVQMREGPDQRRGCAGTFSFPWALTEAGVPFVSPLTPFIT